MAQTWYVLYRESSRYFEKRGPWATYPTVHDEVLADAVKGPGINDALIIGQGCQGTPVSYYIARAGLLFDTSCLPPAMTIDSADVLLWIAATAGGLVPTLVAGVTLTEPLGLADYGGLLPMVASLGSVVVPYPNPPSYVPLPVNALGLAAIDKSGLTKYGFREDWDISATPPGIFSNWTVLMGAAAYNGFRIGQVTVSDLTPTSARLTGEITEVGCAGQCPVVLKVVGDGTGEFSNIDTRLSYSLIPGQDQVRALAYDGTYIYAGLNVTPGMVMKIDPATMTSVSIWKGASGENLVTRLVYDGTYLYASLLSSPAKVVKIDPVTMTTVSTWIASSGLNEAFSLTYDGTYIYTILLTSPAQVVKIDPATMLTVSTWTGASGQNTGYALDYDGTYIYAGLMLTPGQVVQIDPATMTTIATWTGAPGEDIISSVIHDGSYIYAGGLDTEISPISAKVVKIDPATMGGVSTWTGAPGQDQCYALDFDGTHIYAGLRTSPAQVVKINPATMATVSAWTGDTGQDNCYSLAHDGINIYAGLFSWPTQIIQIDPATMTPLAHWVGEDFEYTPWQMNQPFYAPWEEMVTDLVPHTGYSVNVQFRIHGEDTIYDCGGDWISTPHLPPVVHGRGRGLIVG